MQKIYTTVFLVFFCFGVFSQSIQVDSLRNILQNTNDDSSRVDALVDLASHYLYSDPDTVLTLSKEAEKIALSNNYNEGIIDAKSMKGLALDLKNEHVTALQNFIYIAKLAEEINDTTRLYLSYNRIAVVNGKIGQVEEALKYFYLTLSLAEKFKDSSNIALVLMNIGYSYSMLDQDTAALEKYDQALEIAESINDRSRYARIQTNLGISHFELGNYIKSEENFLAAATFFKEKNYKYDLAEAYIGLAKINHEFKHYEKSIDYGEKAYKLASEVDNKAFVRDATLILSKSFEERNDYKQSLFYLQIAKQKSDSLSSSEQMAVIQNLQKNYELEKTQLEVASLNKDKIIQEDKLTRQTFQRNILVVILTFLSTIIYSLFKNNHQKQRNNQKLAKKSEEIETKNIELAKLNKEVLLQNDSIRKQKDKLEELNQIKGNLISIISHDFRSPLKSIEGFLNLLKMDALSKVETQKLISDLSEKIATTSEFLDNMLNWARTQMHRIDSKPTIIDLREIAHNNVLFFKSQSMKKGLKIYNKIHEPIEAFADMNMVEMVVRNLIANAIKFSSDGDKIILNATKNDDEVIFSVEDTGTGISSEILSKLFKIETYSTQGTANERGTGLGLVLCKEFIEKNGGAIWAESKKGAGSIFSFSMPLAPSEEKILDYSH